MFASHFVMVALIFVALVIAGWSAELLAGSDAVRRGYRRLIRRAFAAFLVLPAVGGVVVAILSFHSGLPLSLEAVVAWIMSGASFAQAAVAAVAATQLWRGGSFAFRLYALWAVLAFACVLSLVLLVTIDDGETVALAVGIIFFAALSASLPLVYRAVSVGLSQQSGAIPG